MDGGAGARVGAEVVLRTPATAPATAVVTDAPTPSNRISAIVRLSWRAGLAQLLGTLFTQSLFGSVIVAGWTWRLMARISVRRWTRAAGADVALLTEDEVLSQTAAWPRWIVGGASRDQGRGDALVRRLVLKMLGSLGTNVVLGTKALVATAVLTLPSGVLWAAAWWGGWNNSFNKGYEQASVGPLTGLLGVLAFIVAMMLLPYAQARLAVSGELARGFDVRLIARLVYSGPLRFGLVASVFVLASLPVAIGLALPFSFGSNPEWLDLSRAEVIERLNGYYLLLGFLTFPLYVLAHAVAARCYSGALLRGVKTGSVTLDQLSDVEREVLGALGHLETVGIRHGQSTGSRRWWRRLVAIPAGTLAIAIWAAIWFGLVAQVFVGQFFNYRGLRGWVNQPVVQAPWVESIPAHLRLPEP